MGARGDGGGGEFGEFMWGGLVPIPFIVIGIVAGAVSLGVSIEGAVKGKKWQKRYNRALAEGRQVESDTKALLDDFNRQVERLGRIRREAVGGLKEAAEFLGKGKDKVKSRDFDDLRAISDETIARWKKLNYGTLKSVGIGMGGVSAAGGTGIALGIGRLALGANIAAAPIGIAAAVWSQYIAEKDKRKVKANLAELDRVTSKWREQAAVMQAGQLRMSEMERAMINALIALYKLIAKSDVGDVEDAHRVYKLAAALAELLEQQILTDEQREVLQG